MLMLVKESVDQLIKKFKNPRSAQETKELWDGKTMTQQLYWHYLATNGNVNKK